MPPIHMPLFLGRGDLVADSFAGNFPLALVCLFDLHFKSGTRMPGVKKFEAEVAEFMHEPWRHRSSFDPYASVIFWIPTRHIIDLFWNGCWLQD